MLDTAGRLGSSSGTSGTQPLIVTSLTKATDTNDPDYFPISTYPELYLVVFHRPFGHSPTPVENDRGNREKKNLEALLQEKKFIGEPSVSIFFSGDLPNQVFFLRISRRHPPDDY